MNRMRVTDNPPSWRKLAEINLKCERDMQRYHHPPSTGIILSWRGELRVGCIQHPVDIDFPAIVFISITSKYRDPEFARAYRNIDPGRLELRADPRLDLTGNFHVLHRDGNFLTFMTPEETRASQKSDLLRMLVQVQPRDDGRIDLIPVTERKYEQEPPMPSEKIQ